MTKPRPNARRGAPVTVAADASIRIRLPVALLVAVQEAAGTAGVSAWVRAAIEEKLGRG